jgi:hypothetical protein
MGMPYNNKATSRANAVISEEDMSFSFKKRENSYRVTLRKAGD